MEIFQKTIDKLEKNIEKFMEEKSKLEKRIVTLENDNDDYINKIRELDSWSDELRRKLDATLEENIMQNNEFETLKSEMEEIIQRLKEELQDAKNEINSKNTIIERMTNQRDLLVRSACNEEYDHLNTGKSIKNSYSSKNMNRKKFNSFGDIFSSLANDEKKLRVAIINDQEKIPNKFMESYSKSCLKLENRNQNQQNVEKIEGRNSILFNNLEIEPSSTSICNLNSNVNIEKFPYSEYSSANITPIHNKLDVDGIIINSIAEKTQKNYLYSNSITPINIHSPIHSYSPLKVKEFKSNNAWNENCEDEREFIRNKIELEIQHILDNRKIFLQQALIQENFSFDFLSNNKIFSSSDKQKYMNFNKEKLLKNIDDMLCKIQERKQKITTQKKLIESKIEKVGFKMF